jgi:hypothetical protein
MGSRCTRDNLVISQPLLGAQGSSSCHQGTGPLRKQQQHDDGKVRNTKHKPLDKAYLALIFTTTHTYCFSFVWAQGLVFARAQQELARKHRLLQQASQGDIDADSVINQT